MALALLGLALGGCAATRPMAEDQFTDLQRRLDVTQRETFALRLPANPSTGCSWELTQPLDGRYLRLVRSTYQPSDAEPMGAGGYEVWTFQALGPTPSAQVRRATRDTPAPILDVTPIRLKYVRPGEKDIAPARTAVFDVRVLNWDEEDGRARQQPATRPVTGVVGMEGSHQ